jgi:NADPH-dependent 7-cyano-7-deazaguanine reductase QueF
VELVVVRWVSDDGGVVKLEQLQTYLQPLRVRGLVDEELLNHMFSNIEQLWGISSELLAALEERLQAWSSQQCLGDIFLRLVRHLRERVPAIVPTA